MPGLLEPFPSVKLPNAALAVVEPEKITDYLLNPNHRFGASKARFFIAFGFGPGAWEVLAEAFRRHALENEVGRTKEPPFGPRYEVDGPLLAPDGRAPFDITVWQMDHGEIAPRLITS
jgi:hypothetical protein